MTTIPKTSTTAPGPIHRLPAGQVLSLSLPRACVLRVKQGRLWVTVSRDDRDHFIRAGRSLTVGPGQVVIEADAGPALWAWECALSAAESARQAAGAVWVQRALG